MEPAVKQGLVLGALAGAFIGVFLSLYTGVWACMLLVPFTALMGAAPQFIGKGEDDE
ncbi:MAG: hypothetical protein IJ026_07805 [Candidatus Methanomethylophilaceae archaeon]|nr:hypothetical protein [Candidatus Methanomethylophilaceae archaeon]